MSEEDQRLRLDPVEEISPTPEVEREQVTPARVVKVHNGSAFSIEQADQYLRRHRAKVVSFIGCPKAGKTTASVMLYELAKRRRLGDLGFAGSSTIRGFQERAHLSLVASGRQEPDMQRTSAKSVSFLQLALCESTTRYNILMSDRSGEDFEECLSSPLLMTRFPEIFRADCHVLLVDGAKLIDLDIAPSHLSKVQRLALALAKCKALTPESRVQIVLTKFDKIEGKALERHVTQTFDNFVQQLRMDLRPASDVSSIRLVARPTEDTAYADSLREMVMGWFRESASSSFELRLEQISEQFCMADRLNRMVPAP